MKKVINFLICLMLIIGMAGCGNKRMEQTENEKFTTVNTLDDGRKIYFALDIPYRDSNLSMSFTNNDISVDEFLNKLEYIDTWKDGGSKVYKYNKSNEVFGNDNFYVVACNSMDNIKDIYVAKHLESLSDLCSIKINDLDGVSMTIKEVMDTKAVVIITDTSDRENIYGEEYRIDKKENDVWVALDTITNEDIVWNSIGYSVGDDRTLEFSIDWQDVYGVLESGEYRIVKSTSEAGEGTNHYITSEFVIK